jgi:hypothetical protein
MTIRDPSVPLPVHHVTADEMREMVRAQFAEYDAKVAGEQRRSKVLTLLADRASWGWGSFFFGTMTMVTVEQGDDVDAVPVLVIPALAGNIIIRITEPDLTALGPCPNL